jgi:hypothetical protein
MPMPDNELSAEQSRQIAATIREEIAPSHLPADAGRTGQA